MAILFDFFEDDDVPVGFKAQDYWRILISIPISNKLSQRGVLTGNSNLKHDVTFLYHVYIKIIKNF